MGVFISVACIFLDFECVVGQTRLNWNLFQFDEKNHNFEFRSFDKCNSHTHK